MAAKSIEALTLRDEEIDVELRVLARDVPGVSLIITMDDVDVEQRRMDLDVDTAKELRAAITRALKASGADAAEDEKPAVKK